MDDRAAPAVGTSALFGLGGLWWLLMVMSEVCLSLTVTGNEWQTNTRSGETSISAAGASDPESYFLNILPLEIRILERKSELGEDVKEELNRLREVLKKKDTKAVPKTLLPTKAEQDGGGNSATLRASP